MENENEGIEIERAETVPAEAETEAPAETVTPEEEAPTETEEAPEEEAPTETEEAPEEAAEIPSETDAALAEAEESAEEQTEAGETPTPDVEEEPTAAAEPEKKGGFKKLLKKWWFWLIAVAVVGGLVIGIVTLTGSSRRGGGSSSSSSSYVPYTYVSPYVTMIKDARNSTYGVTYGKAFDSFFTNPRWEYFKASTGEDVVEFTGGFLYSGSPATAKIQFVIDLKEGTFTAYHLSINGEAQSRLLLAAMIQKVFESY